MKTRAAEAEAEQTAPLTNNTDTSRSKYTRLKHRTHQKLSNVHNRIPYIKRLPLPSILIIGFLIFVNLVVWAICGMILVSHPRLLSTAALAYTLGLRHALDADHISAIDLMTRRLIATGQKPVTVGTFFSLGHSTIVIITSIVVAATSAGVSKHFTGINNIGSIIGSSVSAAFLILLGLMNAYILYKLVVQLQKIINSTTKSPEMSEWKLEGNGILFKILKKLFKLIDKPWKMYPLGLLFGLGFDTSSEIALLGISSIQGSKGISIWLILIFPILFTSGMCLIDTIDGSLMMALYLAPMGEEKEKKEEEQSSTLSSLPSSSTSSSSNKRIKDPLLFLYYSIILTFLTILCAIIIGILQLLTMILNVAKPEGKFWNGVIIAGNNYEIIGGSICGSFIIFGGISVLCYKPWRKSIENKRRKTRNMMNMSRNVNDGIGGGDVAVEEGIVVIEQERDHVEKV